MYEKISGHVKNNTIIIDDNLELPDGMKVEIIIPDLVQAPSSGLCGIWDDDRPVENIVEEIISTRSMGRDITL